MVIASRTVQEQDIPHLNPTAKQNLAWQRNQISSCCINYSTLKHVCKHMPKIQKIKKIFDTTYFPSLQINKSDSSENPPFVFVANTRPLNPAEHQMFWQPFFCDLHGNYIPIVQTQKHK